MNCLLLWRPYSVFGDGCFLFYKMMGGEVIRILSVFVFPLLSCLFFTSQPHAVANKWEAIVASATQAEVVNSTISDPTTLLLLSAGLTGLTYLARRRKRE